LLDLKETTEQYIMKTLLNNKNNALNNILEPEEKIFPVKEFLLSHSRLLELNQKELTEKGLNRYEQAEQTRIYELRDKAFLQIREAIAKYYRATIKGDYRFDGMPEIERGIRG